AAGFGDNFAYSTLRVTDYVKLLDAADNAAGSGAEALYANNLIVQNGATLDLNGLHVYARLTQISGSIVNGTVTTLASGGDLPMNSTAPATLATGATHDWTCFGRNGQLVTI